MYCKTPWSCVNHKESFQRDSMREALLALREWQEYFSRLVHVQSILQYIDTDAGCGCWQIVQLKDFDMRSDEAVRHAISRSNVVINCLGADKETMNYSFEEVHIDFAERIARLSAESEVLERLLHVSCIAATPDAPSRRLTTKVPSACLSRTFHQIDIIRLYALL